jgi:hypothetical protein
LQLEKDIPYLLVQFGIFISREKQKAVISLCYGRFRSTFMIIGKSAQSQKMNSHGGVSVLNVCNIKI